MPTNAPMAAAHQPKTSPANARKHITGKSAQLINSGLPVTVAPEDGTALGPLAQIAAGPAAPISHAVLTFKRNAATGEYTCTLGL